MGRGQNRSNLHQGSDEQREVTRPRSHGTLASMKGFPARHLPRCVCHHGKNVQRHLKALPLALKFFFVFKNLYSFFFEENSTLGFLETLFFFFFVLLNKK